jgi:hypothetical protein
MAYIRAGQELPSGNKSESFVIGGPDGLISMYKDALIPYEEIREWFRAKDDDEVKALLRKRLFVSPEELEIVCERLFEERDKGEWDKPFSFEAGYEGHC